MPVPVPVPVLVVLLKPVFYGRCAHQRAAHHSPAASAAPRLVSPETELAALLFAFPRRHRRQLLLLLLALGISL
jgi:hypothetical protein